MRRWLNLLSLTTGVPGVLGLLAWKWLQHPGLLVASLLLLLLASLFLGLEVIVKREEYVSHGDGSAWGYITGLQAVLSGLSHLMLALTLLAGAGISLLFGTRQLKILVGTYPGAPLVLGGLWLFFQGAGVVYGQALSGIGSVPDNRVEAAVQLLNAMLEKGIHFILCLAGGLLAAWGAASLISGRGPMTLLAEVL